VVLVMASDGVILHRIATNNGTVVTTGTGTAIA
jgi:hypothetical protein